MADKIVVRSSAKLNASQIAGFDKMMKEAVGDGSNDVVLDMDDTLFISSMALRTLVKSQRLLNEKGGSLKIINVADVVDEVFDVTGLAGIFDYERK